MSVFVSLKAIVQNELNIMKSWRFKESFPQAGFLVIKRQDIIVHLYPALFKRYSYEKF